MAPLYLATLALELPGAFLRWLIFGLLALVLGYVIPGIEDPDVIATPVALLAGAGPLLWSLAAFTHPGYGLWWRWRSGGRQLSAREREAYDDALALLCEERPERALRYPRPFVVDVEELEAAVRGDALMLSRGLLQRGGTALAAVLAHELCHTSSLDGRLIEALNRLLLGGDPVGPRERSPVVAGDPVLVLAYRAGEVVAGLFRALRRLALWIAGGGLGQLMLSPLWGAHWRRREYAADAFAAEFGQGDELARFLD